ncbi:MAG: hypothetical protein WCG91_04045 [Candidatus Shapirobacteria bacterium]
MKTIFKVIGIVVVALVLMAIFVKVFFFAPTLYYANDTSAAPVTQNEKNVVVSNPAIDHGNLPQKQIGHPNWYTETGTNATYKWTFRVKTGEIGIVGGLVVDGKNGGVYRAYSPGTYTVRIQNGFALTTKKAWAKNEFNFRIGQAVKYKWARGTIDYGPLK